MTEPEETQEETDRTDPILAPPTANPARVQVPPEGLGQQQGDEPEPGASDRRGREEG